MNVGRLVSIYIADTAAAPMRGVQAARLVPGRGIEGDRYFAGSGAFSRWEGLGRDLTLIDQVTLDAVFEEFGLDLR